MLEGTSDLKLYYPVGIERGRISPDQFFGKSYQVYKLVDYLMRRERAKDEGIVLLIANSPANFLAHLPSFPRGAQGREALAREKARATGLLERFSYEAIQEDISHVPGVSSNCSQRIRTIMQSLELNELMRLNYDPYNDTTNDSLNWESAIQKAEEDLKIAIQEGEEETLRRKNEMERTHARVRVALLSEILDEHEMRFVELYGRVEKLLERDSFAAEVFNCIPRMALPKGKRDFGSINPKERSMLMDYVIHQITTVLFLKGKKLGGLREKAYNDVTTLAAELLEISVEERPKFETVDLSGEESPYRGRPLHRAVSGREMVLAGFWRELANGKPCMEIRSEVYHSKGGVWNWDFSKKQSVQCWGREYDQRLEIIHEENERVRRVFLGTLKVIEAANLNEELQSNLRRLTITQYLYGIILLIEGRIQDRKALIARLQPEREKVVQSHLAMRHGPPSMIKGRMNFEEKCIAIIEEWLATLERKEGKIPSARMEDVLRALEEKVSSQGELVELLQGMEATLRGRGTPK